jgi:hypothetical protein
MQLSVLESRLLHNLPEEHHETVKEEFGKFKMETSRVAQDVENYGQATLTYREIAVANTTNQNGDYGHTIIELQCLKAVAIKLEIRDWLSHIDPTLSYGENVTILESKGEPTMKSYHAKDKMKERHK